VNAKDADGETALDEAVEQGNKEIIELLRQHGGKGK
jgi:ankyrin repeat protein